MTSTTRLDLLCSNARDFRAMARVTSSAHWRAEWERRALAAEREAATLAAAIATARASMR
jgi:hypothetical protein